MVSALNEMLKSNPPRAWAIVIVMFFVFIMLLWVSIIDIKRQSIVFWKMLISSSSIILGPLIVSFFYRCKNLGTMKWYIMLSIPAWFLLLYINVKRNRDRFMGRADVDLLSAIFSLGVCYSIWLSTVLPRETVVIKILGFWYRALGYLILGGLVYIGIFIVMLFIKVFIKKQKIRDLMKNTKVSIIPMFMPVSLAVPYMVLMS